MKTFTQEELKLIIEKHGKWLRSEVGGECADLSSADLRSANLRSADLSSADLSSANLSYANLRSANLSSADLSSADLSSADLSSANLRYANLRYADLSYADLSYAAGNSVNLKTLQTNNWPVSYTDTVMTIGCQRHEIKKWFKFTDEEISSMSGDALEWWKDWKSVLKKIIKISPAAPTGYVEPETKAE